MIKPLTFRKAVLASAMLFLCSISLHSCTEEMPILTPSGGFISSSGVGSVSSKSIVNIKINAVQSNITNVKPQNILFTINSGGSTMPSFRSYAIAGDNGSTTNRLLYSVAFHSDSAGNNTYVFDGSQVIANKKIYTSFNISGSNKFSISKLDEKTYSTAGTFGYYVYDDILNPTDSLYVTGSFNILK